MPDGGYWTQDVMLRVYVIRNLQSTKVQSAAEPDALEGGPCPVCIFTGRVRP
jgi:hypothetical protein